MLDKSEGCRILFLSFNLPPFGTGSTLPASFSLPVKAVSFDRLGLIGVNSLPPLLPLCSFSPPTLSFSVSDFQHCAISRSRLLPLSRLHTFYLLFLPPLHLFLHFHCFSSSVVWHIVLPELFTASCIVLLLNAFSFYSLISILSLLSSFHLHFPPFLFYLLKSYLCFFSPHFPSLLPCLSYLVSFSSSVICFSFPAALPSLPFTLLYHSVSSDSCWHLTSLGHCSWISFGFCSLFTNQLILLFLHAAAGRFWINYF